MVRRPGCRISDRNRGGTIRDVLIGRTPVFWLTQYEYLIVILLTACVATPFISKIQLPGPWLLKFDAFGLALFNLIGCQIALQQGLSPVVAILLGVVSGTLGGMLRDIMIGVVPLVLREEIYALAAVLAGISFVLLREAPLPIWITEILTVAICVSIRLIAIKRNWSLPKLG